VINRLATRLAMFAGTLGDGLGRVAVRLSHLSSPGVLAILCVAILTAVQHLLRAKRRSE
jgi:hypothetical protein